VNEQCGQVPNLGEYPKAAIHDGGRSVEDRGMRTDSLLQSRRPSLATRRCECVRCGAHLAGALGRATLGGRCSTCGSYEIALLEIGTMAPKA